MKNVISSNRNYKGLSRGIRPGCTATPEKSGRPATPADARTRFGPGGGIYEIVTTAAESHGRHFAFEATEPPGGGPPLHIHAAEDEYFLVLEGEITFYIGGRIITAKRGESAFVPRGV